MDKCCELMSDALKWGLLTITNDEVTLPLRTLTDVNPDATAGNLLTGETYDPSSFSVTLLLEYCPWCGVKLTVPMNDDDWYDDLDPDELDATLASANTGDSEDYSYLDGDDA